MTSPLDSKELSRGMRVIKVCGERRGALGTVKGIDRGANRIGVLFDGDREITLDCDPGEFEIFRGPQHLHLTGKPPPGTVARGSL